MKLAEKDQIEILKNALNRIIAHETRSDRRHKGMIDITELYDLQRIAKLALQHIKIEG